MPGLQLYQTEVDELLLIRAAFEEGCCLVPDVHSKVPEARRLIDVEEFREERGQTRHFYILTNSMVHSPLSIRKVKKEDDYFYYVSPGVGTPSLEFLGGGLYSGTESGTRLIRSGFLEFSREYWSADLSAKLPSPPELESLFLRLSRAIKTHGSRIKPGKTVFWLGDDAKSQLDGGARLVGYESWSPDKSLLKSQGRTSAKLAS